MATANHKLSTSIVQSYHIQSFVCQKESKKSIFMYICASNINFGTDLFRTQDKLWFPTLVKQIT